MVNDIILTKYLPLAPLNLQKVAHADTDLETSVPGNELVPQKTTSLRRAMKTHYFTITSQT